MIVRYLVNTVDHSIPSWGCVTVVIGMQQLAFRRRRHQKELFEKIMITMAGQSTHSKERRNVTGGRAVEVEYEYVSTTTHIHKAAMVNEEERSPFTK